jgi:hypothetical protein
LAEEGDSGGGSELNGQKRRDEKSRKQREHTTFK